jgi:DNA-binding CsgD family transcriptional regulator
LEFVHAVSSTDSSEPFEQETLGLLEQAVPGDSVTYSEWDTNGPRATKVVGEPLVSITPEIAEARRELCCSYPLSVVRHRSEERALKISDFVSLRELRRSEYYDAVLKPLGVEHELRMWLTAPRGTCRLFAFSRSRGEGDFGERDRALLELLRPFLVASRERYDTRRALTDREAEILRWVARGKTNREIATLLYVSPHTVRTHLEHVFAKLDVHTRAAAIAAAFADSN